ncbi:hypothetical protein [uncultured Methanolobus sp.]|uniref:zinc ribbon domain-containing protein n=1 Tax=uncultured Methanolobus sp. TaxID=218300 RepID=UPI0029C7EBC0|nr:hypothetical protein [uncultured Methanolobus sp.]
MYCNNCGNEINDVAYCPHCGNSTTENALNKKNEVQNTRNPGTAAVLSFFIPGLGQIYSGMMAEGLTNIFISIVAGLLMMFLSPLAVFIFVLYVIFWLHNIKEAYDGPKSKNDVKNPNSI